MSASIAIDILIEPNGPMIERAERVNAACLAMCPEGFPLDEAHRPHITMLQAYAATERLGDVYAAVGEVLAGVPITAWALRAVRYYYLPWGSLGVAGIVVEPTGALLELQQSMFDAVTPFLVDAGGADAFVTTIADPEINQPTIDYVAAYTATNLGADYNPHVTVGVAPQPHLDAMIAEPFEEFSFAPAGVAVYQLGNLGTAAKRLHSWTDPAAP